MMNTKFISNVFFAATLLLLATNACTKSTDSISYNWNNTVDRIWAGQDFWANRLQDWEIKDNRLVCIRNEAHKPMRTVHLLSTRLKNPGNFISTVKTGYNTQPEELETTSATGFLIGAGATLDYRAAALIHHSPGKEGGLFVGINANNEVFIQDFSKEDLPILASTKLRSLAENYTISVRGTQSETAYELNATVSSENGDELGVCSITMDTDTIFGNIALVSHPGEGKISASYWFDDLYLSGEKFETNKTQTSGPIVTAQYTLDSGILKMNAQLMPVGKTDSQEVVLELEKEGEWQEVARGSIQQLSYNALLRVENYTETTNTNYRIVYQTNGQDTPYHFEGNIRANPVSKEEIVVAGFTGNHMLAKGVERKPFNWQTQIWFPHTEVVENVIKHQPDLLFFSGDQIYEGASPTVPDRKNILIDYMYKWYLWCWAYSSITKDIPTVTIPDDHDVFQGNVWGNGGGDTDVDSKGGYVWGSEFVQMVERTQVSHLPDAFDPTPIKTGIGVYYTSLNIGRVNFAIIEDRKFKSGPFGLVPPTKSGRPDHVIDPNYTFEMADVPGAKLLGERQLYFLETWSQDWKQTDMKVVLSQTIFGNMATHHGGNLQHLYMDFDSNGWPQTGRNKALEKIRKGYAFMLGGDQHLATIVHHGIDEQNDAGWSFCVPSVANFYPRAWMPFDDYGANYKEGLQKYTGEYLDGLGNKVNVFAHTNPDLDFGIEPKNLHNKMPGYGILRLDKTRRTITMECWPRFADPHNPTTGSQYTGWPMTVDQEDQYGRRAQGWLPTVEITNAKNAVVQVFNEQTNEHIYSLRTKDQSFKPKVFAPGTYTLKVTEPDTGFEQVFKGLKAVRDIQDQQIQVTISK